MNRQLYPVFLSLEDMNVLILGLGEVGCRKLAVLLPCAPASVRILEPGPLSEEAVELQKEAHRIGVSLSIESSPFREGMLDGVDLVFTCTGDHELNAYVARMAKERGLLCNCTDAPSQGSFHVPAQARSGPLVAALSSGGASPALTRRWKMELESWLERKRPITALMGILRPEVIALGLGPRRNREIFRSLSDPLLEGALADGDRQLAASILRERLPEALADRTGEFLNASDPLS